MVGTVVVRFSVNVSALSGTTFLLCARSVAGGAVRNGTSDFGCVCDSSCVTVGCARSDETASRPSREEIFCCKSVFSCLGP